MAAGTEDVVVAAASAEIGKVRYATAIRARHHALVADESAHLGGGDAGPNPFELVLSGLGACTAITLRMYADRKGWPLAGVRVDLAYHCAGETAYVARRLHFDGPLDEAQRARLADIAERTPVTLMVKQGTEIRTALM